MIIVVVIHPRTYGVPSVRSFCLPHFSVRIFLHALSVAKPLKKILFSDGEPPKVNTQTHERPLRLFVRAPGLLAWLFCCWLIWVDIGPLRAAWTNVIQWNRTTFGVKEANSCSTTLIIKSQHVLLLRHHQACSHGWQSILMFLRWPTVSTVMGLIWGLPVHSTRLVIS